MNYQRVKEISEQSKREKWPTPTTFEMLKAAGITSYRFNVSAYETVFTGTDGTNFAEPAAGVSRIDIAPVLDVSAVVTAIRRPCRRPILECGHEGAHLHLRRHGWLQA